MSRNLSGVTHVPLPEHDPYVYTRRGVLPSLQTVVEHVLSLQGLQGKTTESTRLQESPRRTTISYSGFRNGTGLLDRTGPSHRKGRRRTKDGRNHRTANCVGGRKSRSVDEASEDGVPGTWTRKGTNLVVETGERDQVKISKKTGTGFVAKESRGKVRGTDPVWDHGNRESRVIRRRSSWKVWTSEGGRRPTKTV